MHGIRGLFCLPLLVAVMACSNQEAGRSDYFRNLDNPNAVNPPVTSLNRLSPPTIQALKAEEDAVAAGALSADAALVASLNSAIERAGLQEAPPVEASPTAPIGSLATLPAPAQPEQPTSTVPTLPAATPGSTEITDNSFGTVSAQQTIETDRERLAAIAAQRVELEAEPLPDQTTRVNLAAFARETTHKIGDRVYQRSGLIRNRASAQCRKYRNPDEAQRAFLTQGGPVKDPMRMDPDGDGFVCGWSPMPFRALQLPG